MKEFDISDISRIDITPFLSVPFLRLVASSYGSLTYEMLFVLDLQDGRLRFVSDTSGFAHRFLKTNFQERTFKSLVETVSGQDVLKIDTIFSLIQAFYKAHPVNVPEKLLFMTDMQMVFYREAKASVTYKFVPYLIGEDRALRYLLGSLGLSSGLYRDKIVAINTENNEEFQCDIESQAWQKVSRVSLTPIELIVLSLSAQGLHVNDIAAQISKARDSVKAIRKRIFGKMGVTNIMEAVIFAVNHKLI